MLLVGSVVVIAGAAAPRVVGIDVTLVEISENVVGLLDRPEPQPKRGIVAMRIQHQRRTRQRIHWAMYTVSGTLSARSSLLRLGVPSFGCSLTNPTRRCHANCDLKHQSMEGF